MKKIQNENLSQSKCCNYQTVNVSNIHSTCPFSPYAMQIMLGEHDVRVFEGTEQLMKTDTIIWHPEWAEIFHSCFNII